METPVKHTASALRAMLKEHKASMPRLSAKKHELMDYAGKIGLLKAAAVPPPSPPPEAPVQKKKSGPTTAVAPASAELPKELKKPEPKAPKPTKKTEPPAPSKKSFSESAKGGLAAYASFVADKKARGMSHKEATEAWKARK
jgi:hypothetical protein